MNPRLALPVALALAALTACGSDDTTSDTPTPTTAAVTAPASPASPASPAPATTAAATGYDLDTMSAALQDAVPEIVDVVPLTEDNDANDLIGRPGKYDAAIFFADERLDCDGPSYDELSTNCGAKIERWPDEAAAKARAEDIQTKLRDYGLGAEYDYVFGALLLRIAGDIKPTEAEIYRAAAEASGS